MSRNKPATLDIVAPAAAPPAVQSDSLPDHPAMPGLREDIPWAQAPGSDFTEGTGADPEADLSRVLAEFGSGDEGGSVTLMWANPAKGNKFEWIKKYTVAEFLALGVSGVSREFGPGTYMAYIYAANERGIKARRTFTISERAGAIAQPGGAPAPSASMAGLETLANAMTQGFSGLAQLLAQQNRGPSEKEILDRMLIYKQLFAPAGGAAQSPSDPFSMMKMALEMARDIAAPAEPSMLDTVGKFLEKFQPMLMKGLEAVQAQQTAPAAAAPVNMQTLAPIAPATPGDNAAMFQNAMQAKLRDAINTLCDAARNGRNTQTYAELILDQIEGTPIEAKFYAMLDDDLIGELAKIDPRVNQWRPWFDQLRTDIVAMTAQDKGAASDPMGGAEDDPGL